MARRLALLGAEDLAPRDADLVASGHEVHRALANSPGAARAVRALAVYLRRESPLDGRLRELAILQVCYVLRADYEYAHHIKIALGIGVAASDIAAIAMETAGGSGHFDALERHVLRAARELTLDLAIADSTFEVLRRHLDPPRLADLIVVISTYSAIVRICNGLAVALEPEFLEYLQRFPLR